MTSIISKCSFCDQFFDFKKKLRDHKDKDHRITDLKMISIILTENQTKQALLLLSKGVIMKKKTSKSRYYLRCTKRFYSIMFFLLF